MLSRQIALGAIAILFSAPVKSACSGPYVVGYDLTSDDIHAIAEITYLNGKHTFEKARILSTRYDSRNERFNALIVFEVERLQNGLQVQDFFSCSREPKKNWSCTTTQKTMLSVLDACDSMVEVIGKPPASASKLREVVTAAMDFMKKSIDSPVTKVSWTATQGFSVTFEGDACRETVPVKLGSDAKTYQVPNPTQVFQSCL